MNENKFFMSSFQSEQNPQSLNSDIQKYQEEKIKQFNILNILNLRANERSIELQQLYQKNSKGNLRNFINNLKDGQGQNIKKSNYDKNEDLNLIKNSKIRVTDHLNYQTKRLSKKKSTIKYITDKKNQTIRNSDEQNEIDMSLKMQILQKIAQINSFKYQNAFISKPHFQTYSPLKKSYETIDIDLLKKSQSKYLKHQRSRRLSLLDEITKQTKQQNYLSTLNSLDVKKRFHLNKKKLYKTVDSDKTGRDFFILQNSQIKLSTFIQKKNNQKKLKQNQMNQRRNQYVNRILVKEVTKNYIKQNESKQKSLNSLFKSTKNDNIIIINKDKHKKIKTKSKQNKIQRNQIANENLQQNKFFKLPEIHNLKFSQ